MDKKLEIPIFIEDEECLPFYATTGASGADVRARLKESVIIPSGCSAAVPTGIKVAIPHGFEIQVRPRSGLAFKNQITVLNTPGTIDADYRGEIQIILINHGKENFVVTPGMRIAQLIVTPVIQANFVVAENLSETQRGAGGLGHSGIH